MNGAQMSTFVQVNRGIFRFMPQFRPSYAILWILTFNQRVPGSSPGRLTNKIFMKSVISVPILIAFSTQVHF
jgi:hypothetical protein